MRRILAFAILLAPALASAHARFMDPTPRFDPPNNPGGIKEAAAPCGAVKPPTAAHVYEVGSTITVKIDETIVHPGHYELYWSNAGDAAFTIMPGMDNIVNPDGKQVTSVQVTLPATVMDNATLQLRMVMTENPAVPTNYYSCADIKLVPVGSDLAAIAVADLAIPAGTDLAGFNDTDDQSVAGGGEDGGTASTDMAQRPKAEDAGLPGCSMTGHGGGALPLVVLLLLVFAASAVPAWRRGRKP